MALKEAAGETLDEDVNWVKFEKIGDAFKGLLKKKTPSDKYGMNYEFEVEGVKHVLVGKIDLNKKMEEVPEGNWVELELVELSQTGKGNKMKIFKVLYDESGIPTESVK